MGIFSFFKKSWEGEHEEMLILAEKVIADYVRGEEERAKNELFKLLEKLDQHITMADLSGSNITSKDELNKKLKEYIKEDTKLDHDLIDIMNSVISALHKHQQESQ